MNDKQFQIKVLERLTAIETTLKQIDYKSISEKINEEDKKIVLLEDKTKDNEKRIDKIEDNGRWLWRTVAGSIILALLGLILKIK